MIVLKGGRARPHAELWQGEGVSHANRAENPAGNDAYKLAPS